MSSDFERKFFESIGRGTDYEMMEENKEGLRVLKSSSNPEDYTNGSKVSYGLESSDIGLMEAAGMGFTYANKLLEDRKKMRANIIKRAREGVPTSYENLRIFSVSIPDYEAAIRTGIQNKITFYEKLSREAKSESERASYEKQVEYYKNMTNKIKR